jgi:hypothetical protein
LKEEHLKALEKNSWGIIREDFKMHKGPVLAIWVLWDHPYGFLGYIIFESANPPPALDRTIVNPRSFVHRFTKIVPAHRTESSALYQPVLSFLEHLGMSLAGFEFEGPKTDWHVPVLVANQGLETTSHYGEMTGGAPLQAAAFPHFLWPMLHEGKCFGYLFFESVSIPGLSLQLRKIHWTRGTGIRSAILRAAINALHHPLSHYYNRRSQYIELTVPSNIIDIEHDLAAFSDWQTVDVKYKCLQVSKTT